MKLIKNTLFSLFAFVCTLDANYVYITDENTMKIIDVSTPSTPILKSTIQTSSSFMVEVNDDTAYVAEFSQLDSDYMKIIDVSDKTSPTILSTIDRNSPILRVSDMLIDSSLIYLGDEYRGLHSMDIASTAITQNIFENYDVISMTLLNNELYIINAEPNGLLGELQRLDISAPNSPVMLQSTTNGVDATSYPTEESTHHSWVRNDGTYIYIANVGDKELKKYDAQSLSLISSVNIGGHPTAFEIEGQYGFVTMHAHDLEPSLQISDDAIKMVNLDTMSISDSHTLSDASGVDILDSYVYVTDNTGLHIYDISQGNLTLVSDFSDGSGNFITIQANDTNDTNNTPITTGGGGCGCSHDPNAGFDVMFFFILAIALIYPWRKKMIRS